MAFLVPAGVNINAVVNFFNTAPYNLLTGVRYIGDATANNILNNRNAIPINSAPALRVYLRGYARNPQGYALMFQSAQNIVKRKMILLKGLLGNVAVLKNVTLDLYLRLQELGLTSFFLEVFFHILLFKISFHV